MDLSHVSVCRLRRKPRQVCRQRLWQALSARLSLPRPRLIRLRLGGTGVHWAGSITDQLRCDFTHTYGLSASFTALFSGFAFLFLLSTLFCFSSLIHFTFHVLPTLLTLVSTSTFLVNRLYHKAHPAFFHSETPICIFTLIYSNTSIWMHNSFTFTYHALYLLVFRSFSSFNRSLLFISTVVHITRSFLILYNLPHSLLFLFTLVHITRCFRSIKHLLTTCDAFLFHTHLHARYFSTQQLLTTFVTFLFCIQLQRSLLL